MNKMSGVNSQGFNPLQYTTPISSENYPENTISSDPNFDEIVTKGGKKMFKVDIRQFDKLCEKFQPMSHMRIKELKGRDKEDFNLMVSYVHLLYGTDYYKHLYRKVKKYFSDLDEVRPGTVGGYFGGCLVKTSFEEQPGCAVSCAGSVPRPKDEEGWSFCDKAVIFAENRGYKGYSFSVLKEPERPEDMDPCYLFVEHTDIHDFMGFDKREKAQLEKMGVDRVYLIGCNETGTEYVDLYDDIRNVTDIKHRKKRTNNTDNSGLGLALILIIIFLVFVIFFFGWRFWDKDYSVNDA